VLRRSFVAAAVALTAVATSAFSPAGAVTPPVAAAADRAADWLESQQQPDGGFELAGFPGFETSDAVLAIAMAAQTGAAWSTSEALAAIEALAYGGPGGPTPIDALDAWVTGGINAGEAAKLMLLVIEPLGLDPGDFGPSHTDVFSILYPSGTCAGGPDLSGTYFYEKLSLGLATKLLCGAVDPAVVSLVRAAQRPDGAWNNLGDPTLTTDLGDEVDVTSIATQVLIASGAAWDDPAVLRALGYLATMQDPTGAFRSYGEADPNATAMAMLVITAAGFDPTVSCWRDTAVPARAGTPYGDPEAWSLGRQQPDGRVVSPNDGYGVNSFPTSQSVEGWLRTWVPITRATGAPDCRAVPDPDPVVPEPRFTG
jgi:hypothetical protein